MSSRMKAHVMGTAAVAMLAAASLEPLILNAPPLHNRDPYRGRRGYGRKNKNSPAQRVLEQQRKDNLK